MSQDVINFLTDNQKVNFIRANFPDYIETDYLDEDVLLMLNRILPNGDMIDQIIYTAEVATVLDKTFGLPKELLKIISVEIHDYNSVISFCNSNTWLSQICRDKFFWINFLRGRGYDGSLIDLTLEELKDVAKIDAHISSNPKGHNDRLLELADENIIVMSTIYLWYGFPQLDEHILQFFLPKFVENILVKIEDIEIEELTQDVRDFKTILLLSKLHRKMFIDKYHSVFIDHVSKHLLRTDIDVFRKYRYFYWKAEHFWYLIFDKLFDFIKIGGIELQFVIDVLDTHKPSFENLNSLFEIYLKLRVSDNIHIRERYSPIYEFLVQYLLSNFSERIITLDLSERIRLPTTIDYILSINEQNKIMLRKFLTDDRITPMILIDRDRYDKYIDFLEPYQEQIIIIESRPELLIRNVDPNIFD